MSDNNVEAKDLLDYNQERLAHYLERNAVPGGGGFNISALAGLFELSPNQRDGLGDKLRRAANPDNISLDFDNLSKRLTRVDNDRDSSPAPNLPPSPSETEDSSLQSITFVDLETSSHSQLIDDGGRPACSLAEWIHILDTPTASYQALLPWLSDCTDSDIRDRELKTFFSRQFDRWWDFRKSQWDNRGIGDSEEGISAFVKASKSRYERMGCHAMVSASSFADTIRQLWQRKPLSRQPPGDQGFKSYSNAATTRLAPYSFARTVRLKKNPHEQTPWTNWLEYLSYEKWRLEELTAVADALEESFHHAMQRLLEVSRYPSRVAIASCNTKTVSDSATSGCTQSRQRSTKDANLAEERDAALAAVDATSKTIDDFLRETEPFADARRAVRLQRRRVEWVIKEARSMETEMALQSMPNIANINTKSNKRRRGGHDDEDETIFQTRPTKTKRHQCQATYQPRRSQRLANEKAPLTIGRI